MSMQLPQCSSFKQILGPDSSMVYAFDCRDHVFTKNMSHVTTDNWIFALDQGFLFPNSKDSRGNDFSIRYLNRCFFYEKDLHKFGLATLNWKRSQWTYEALACLPGMGYWPNLVKPYSPSCEKCSPGWYGQNSKCNKCPAGTSTNNSMSISITNCSVCTLNRNKGDCVVLSDNTAVCQCYRPGYYRDSSGICSVLSAIEIATLSSSEFVLLLAVIGVLLLLRKAHQAKGQKENKLRTLENVWEISFREIELKSRIDTKVRGAYGEVYSGVYRGLPVAIKKLEYYQMQLIKRSKFEFFREIAVMMSIRHPNIVMFYGGGNFQDGTPFLVLEMMERGSLRAVLGDESIELTNEDKFCFALDGCRGMNYLHQTNPPRVHRDLKSANLLVSGNWVVRVADFGSARLLQSNPEEVHPQKKDKVLGRNSVQADDVIESRPLLEENETSPMTLEVGTTQWLAPEVLQNFPYGASVDVYRYIGFIITKCIVQHLSFSYGVVMWEIWTKNIPYEEQRLTSTELKEAIVSGLKPPLDENFPVELSRIIEQCWNKDGRCRPTFADVEEIVEKLVPFDYSVSKRKKAEGTEVSLEGND